MLKSKIMALDNLTSCLGQPNLAPRPASNIYQAGQHPSEFKNSLPITEPDLIGNNINSRYSILILDDSEYNLSYIKMLFENLGFNPRTAHSPIQALTIIQELLENKTCKSCAVFDLILTDLEMPFMDGVEFAHSVREFEEYSDVPIVCSSANEIEPECAEVFTSFIKKPITNQDVVELVENLLPKVTNHTCEISNGLLEKKDSGKTSQRLVDTFIAANQTVGDPRANNESKASREVALNKRKPEGNSCAADQNSSILGELGAAIHGADSHCEIESRILPETEIRYKQNRYCNVCNQDPKYPAKVTSKTGTFNLERQLDLFALN